MKRYGHLHNSWVAPMQSYISKCSKEFLEAGQSNRFCSVKSVVSMRYKVALLAAVPGHLFDLTGGSIPSATSMCKQQRGTRHLRTQTKARNNWQEKCSLAGCVNVWVAPGIFFVHKTCNAICLLMVEFKLGLWFRFGAAAWSPRRIVLFYLWLLDFSALGYYGLGLAALFGASSFSELWEMQLTYC